MAYYEKYFLKEVAQRSYKTSEEQIKELFCFLDVLLNIVVSFQASEKEIKGSLLKGVPVPKDDVVMALTSYELQDSHMELLREVREDIAKIRVHLLQRSNLSKNNVFLRFTYIVEEFHLSNIEVICLLLALAVEYDKKYELIYGAIEHNQISQAPTKGIAIAIMESFRSFSMKDWTILADEESNLERFLLKKSKTMLKVKNVYSEELYVKKRVAKYLFGDDAIEKNIAQIGELFSRTNARKITLDIHQEVAQNVCQLLQKYRASSVATVINLVGVKGIGKKTILKYVANQFGISLLFIDICLLAKYKEEKKEWLDNIFLEASLSDAIVCFLYEIKEEEVLLEEVLQYAQTHFQLFFLLSSQKLPKMKQIFVNRFSIELPMLSVKERTTLWNVFSLNYVVEKEILWNLISSKYLLTPKSIQEVLATAWLKCCSENRKAIMQQDIVFAVHQQNANQLGNMATLINAVFTWDDLVVEEEQKKQMRLICNQLKNRGVLEEEWGFGKKMPYGRGISVLFYGTPGTGKTMAAQVMANELGIDLYRIDISQMVSKYIGETEKNIGKLFEKAKNINALLFFDEADSLFAKRSEVKDSHDRNANMETAYLLQKLEDYEGISILATNYLNNMDDAFKRRIRFIVNFSLPSADIRYELWKSMLPKEAKVKDTIDLSFFATNFELSGSAIKEILINAAHMAIADNKAISNYYIIQAIKNNFQKNGKLLIASDFGEYEVLF